MLCDWIYIAITCAVIPPPVKPIRYCGHITKASFSPTASLFFVTAGGYESELDWVHGELLRQRRSGDARILQRALLVRCLSAQHACSRSKLLIRGRVRQTAHIVADQD